MRTFQFLALMRPANVLTAISDVLAGAAIAGIFNSAILSDQISSLALLCLATSGLYAGGIVFNDYFDRDIDRVERPERLIPSGQILAGEALVFGLILLLAGITAAFFVNSLAGVIALLISGFALFYDRFGKHHSVLGPINMGVCRGLNLVLGMSILASTIQTDLVWMGLLPIIFIAAITLTAQGEVQGNNRKSVMMALSLDGILLTVIMVLGFRGVLNLWESLPFLLLWFGINAYGKVSAIINNNPENVMRAVKNGIISLIPLNAVYTAGFGHWSFGLAVLLLLPLVFFLSKKFAVT